METVELVLIRQPSPPTAVSAKVTGLGGFSLLFSFFQFLTWQRVLWLFPPHIHSLKPKKNGVRKNASQELGMPGRPWHWYLNPGLDVCSHGSLADLLHCYVSEQWWGKQSNYKAEGAVREELAHPLFRAKGSRIFHRATWYKGTACAWSPVMAFEVRSEALSRSACFTSEGSAGGGILKETQRESPSCPQWNQHFNTT